MNVKEIIPIFMEELSKLEKSIQDNFNSDIPLIPTVSKHLADAGGKRLRPLLILICARMAGYKNDIEDINIKCATAIEYIHIATLLHDDVIDTAEMRRGRTSANVIYGNSASVLVGDFLFAKSFSILAQNSDPRVMQSISDATVYLTEGEVKQMDNLRKADLSREDYFDTIDRKTAALIAVSCKVGGIIGGGSDEEVDALEKFGRNIGIAFQLIDDLMDYTSEAETIGKPVNDDIKRGSVTLPLIYLYENGNLATRQMVEKVIKGEASEEEVNSVVAQVNESGAIEHLLEEAKNRIKIAKDSIQILSGKEQHDCLLAIADYVTERKL